MIKDTAHFLHGELERNWACHEDPYYTPRRRNIQQMTTPSHRIGEGIMLSLARRYPNATSAFLRRSLDDSPSYRLAGAGSVHTTVTDGIDVFKIHRRSSFMPEREREQLASTFKSRYSIMKKYMGELTVPQSTMIIPNKLNRKRPSVTTIQKFYEFDDPGIFDGYEAAIDEEAFENCKKKYPGIEDAFKDLAIAGLDMFDRDGLLPDTSGLNNIVIIDGNLKNIDGIPMSPTHPGDIERIALQLHEVLTLCP